jgi:hypothetical protein
VRRRSELGSFGWRWGGGALVRSADADSFHELPRVAGWIIGYGGRGEMSGRALVTEGWSKRRAVVVTHRALDCACASNVTETGPVI